MFAPRWVDRDIVPKTRRASLSQQRGVCGSRPTFTGTRLTPDIVWSLLDHGCSEAVILKQYPTMTKADIRLAKALRHAVHEYEQGRR